VNFTVIWRLLIIACGLIHILVCKGRKLQYMLIILDATIQNSVTQVIGCLGFVYPVDTNWNDTLALLLDVCYTVPGLMCVLWKVTRITGVKLCCSGMEHA